MIKTLIIDDEEHVRKDVRKKVVSNFPKKIAILAEASSVAEALKAIETFEPDLLLLDVNLQDGTGFDVIKKTDYKNFDVIFITGYDNHAINAIKVGALDYLMKPLDEDEFKEAIIKTLERDKKEPYLDKLVEVSHDYFKGTEKKRIILKTSSTVYAIYEDDIIYCISDGNYTTFHTSINGNIVISKPLKAVEELLSSKDFVRCHQSYIVNKKHVIKYNRNGNLILNAEIKVPVSSRRKDYTLERIFK